MQNGRGCAFIDYPGCGSDVDIFCIWASPSGSKSKYPNLNTITLEYPFISLHRYDETFILTRVWRMFFDVI